MFNIQKTVKDFSQFANLDEDAANIEFVKNYMADMHKMIDSQVRNSLISLCHVVIYRIRSQQSSIRNRPEKILDDIYKFCFSLTTVDSTEEFNQKLINFIDEGDTDDKRNTGKGFGENSTTES
jgi:hypothetical protein